MDIKLFVYHFAKCTLDIGKVYLLLHFVIGFPEKTSKLKIMSAVILCGASIAFFIKIMNPAYIAISYIVIVLVAMFIMTKINSLSRILLTLISFLCASEIDFFIGAIIGLLPKPLTGIVDLASIVNGCFSLALIATISLLCGYFDISFYKEKIVRSRWFIAIETIVLLVNLLIMGTIFGSLSHAKSNSANILLTAAMSLSMMISVISLIFYAAVHNAREYKNKNNLNEELLRIQRHYFTYEKTINQNVRKFRHDLNNHLSILKGMLDNGNTIQAGKYLEDMLKRAETLKPVIQSGNETMDILLNRKYYMAASEEIELRVNGTITGPLAINDFDLCTIFINGIDNAIEACRHLEREKKYIDVSFANVQNYLRVKIKNPVSGEVTLATWKKNKRDHGLGLSNIYDAVERNDGDMKISVEDQCFILDIVLKVPQDHPEK